MLSFVMGMPCLSVVNMLQMTLRCVMECRKILSRMFNLLCIRQLLGLRTIGKVRKSGLKLVKIPSVTLKT
jgi:hypothetical protein